VQLTKLIQSLGAGAFGELSRAVTGLPLQPLCDSAGLTVGYAAAVYNGASQQVTVLRFDAELQPVATLVTGLHPCPTGGCDPAAQIFQSSDLVCVDDGTGIVREAWQIVTRDATGTITALRLEDPATRAPITGSVVECVC